MSVNSVQIETALCVLVLVGVFSCQGCLVMTFLLYRSQDKGFHVEKALLHVFTRSLHYSSAQTLTVEEVVEGAKVQYTIPVELSDYIFRYNNTHALFE